MDINDITIIREDVFTKKERGDELLKLEFEQKSPFLLTIMVDYRKRETVLEFTAKVLLSEYHQLIRLSNIHTCLNNINAMGICKIKSFISATVVKCDITNDYPVFNVKDLSSFLQNNLCSYKKYVPRQLTNGNFIVEKNVTTRQCKKRLTVYDKGKEMYLAENRQFLEDYYDDVNPFVKKARFELNLNSQKQIRSTLHIVDTTLKDVLLSAQSVNPFYEFLDEILERSEQTKNKGNTVADYKIYCVLKDCDFDIDIVKARLSARCGKGTKISTMLKPYKAMLAEINKDPNGYTRDIVLDLVKTETHITPKLISQYV